MIHVSEPTINFKEAAYICHALACNQLSAGDYVSRFEMAIAEASGAAYALVTSSGTTALHLMLAAAGIGSGMEVIVPDLTFVATANAVTYTGAKVALADVDPLTWTLNQEDVQRKMTGKTVAIIPVHLYGKIAEIPDGLIVFEDSAEAMGIGLSGEAAAFSFYGNKIVSTGEGGAVVTNNAELYDRMKRLRNGAMSTRYYHDEIGFNYRMSELQAAVGLAQMEKLQKLIERRDEIALIYKENLKEFTFQVGERACWWMVAVRVKERARVMRELEEKGIETRPGFVPLHRMPMYADGWQYPVSDVLSEEILCLPTHANLKDKQVVEICDALKEAVYG